ncbi:MAG: DUF2345 domain-containing protein [Zoogloeaceae bacterium]|nr:DUF2345 domain-containing protein [Zoogloeaceae bacterium]
MSQTNTDGGLKPALQPSAATAGPVSSGQTHAAGSFKPTAGGEGCARAWSAPRLQYSAPGGIAQLTPASAILVAGKTLSLAAQDINLIVQGNHSLAVKDGLALFTVGKASGSKPNTETGIALHAASGKVSVQAQSGQLRAAADKTVTVASTTANLKASAKTHLLATAGGAYLKLEGGNIELHAPGPVKLKASLKSLTGPAMATPEGLKFPTDCEPRTEAYVRQVFDEAFVLRDTATQQALAGAPYRLVNNAGDVVAAGITDENGRTARVRFSKAEQIKVLWGH